MPDLGLPAPSGLRRVLIGLCITETTSWGLLYYAFAVLLVPISQDTGWSEARLSAAFSCGLVVSAVPGIWVGRLIDCHGPRIVMTSGSILGSVSLVAVALAPTYPMFFAAWVLAGRRWLQCCTRPDLRRSPVGSWVVGFER